MLAGGFLLPSPQRVRGVKEEGGGAIADLEGEEVNTCVEMNS